MVTTENYEEYMMMDADGELDAAGKAALQDFMATHPALKVEYALWKSLKLRPVDDLTFPDKEALKQRESRGRVIGLRAITLAAAAAVLAAIVLIPALWPREVDRPAIVHEFSDPEPALPVKDYYADSLSKIGVFAPGDKPRPPAKRGMVTERSRIAKKVPVPPSVTVPVRQDSVIALHSVRPDALSETGIQSHVPTVGDLTFVKEHPQQFPTTGEPRQPLITLAPENRQAFQLLKQAFEKRVSQASSATKTLRETALVIKLGNGSVNINL